MPPGLIIFDEDVTNYVAPSTRQGQIFRLLHAIEKAAAGHPHGLRQTVRALSEFPAPPRHRGGACRIFTKIPDTIVKTVEPLRFRGNEVILFHVLDPQESKPKFREPVLLVDMENAAIAGSFAGVCAHTNTGSKIDAHIEALASKARGAGLDYFLMDTARPLDEGLREYLAVRQGRM